MAEERAERRLAAILAADVVGYSRMMGEDETGMVWPPGPAANRSGGASHRTAA